MADTHHDHGTKDFSNDQSPYSHPDVHLHHDDTAGVPIRKKIWQVFWILFAITAVEFAVAFTVGRGATRNITFIILTLVKAFYIVGTFMHLKDEVKNFVWTILIPLLFVVWLILALLIEGEFYRNGWYG